MGTGGSFPGVKRPGREADHSPPTSTEVKKMWSIHPLPHTPSWRSAQLVKHGDNFTFTTSDLNKVPPHCIVCKCRDKLCPVEKLVTNNWIGVFRHLYNYNHYHAGFYVLTEVVTKNFMLWDKYSGKNQLTFRRNCYRPRICGSFRVAQVGREKILSRGV
jgi:hypothetical protein